MISKQFLRIPTLAIFSLVVLLNACSAGTGANTAANTGGTTSGNQNNPPPTPTVASVTVSPISASVSVAATTQFTATAKDSSGNPVNGANFTWMSSDTTIATISNTGLTTGIQAGTANITAAANGINSIPVSLTVTQPAPALNFSNSPLPSSIVGQQYTNTLAASGGTQPYAYSIVAGSLPVGLSARSSNNSLVITGVPNDHAGNFVFSVEVTDSSSPVQTKAASFTLTLAAATPPPPAADIHGQWEFKLYEGNASPSPIWGNFVLEQQNSVLSTSSGNANLTCRQSDGSIVGNQCTSWACFSGYWIALNGTLNGTNLYVTIGCVGNGGKVTNPQITLAGSINAEGTTANGTFTGGDSTGATWSAFRVSAITGSYVASSIKSDLSFGPTSMTATIVENADSSVTATINTTESGRYNGRNFTGSLLGGILSLRDDAYEYSLTAEVDEQGNLQGQMRGSTDFAPKTTFTLTPSH